MTESEVTRAILLATSHLVVWFRNNQVVVGFDLEGNPCAVSRAVRVARVGVGGKGGSDFVGVRRSDGKAVFMEVKGTRGKVSKEQLEFLELVRRNTPAIAFVARSAEEALKELGK